MVKDMDLVNKHFKMVLIMKENGIVILYKDMEDIYFKMEIIMKVILFMVKEKEEVH